MKGFHLGLRRFCSIILGLVYFLAGMFKLMDPVGSGLIVDGYLSFLHLGGLSFASKELGVLLSLLETLLGAALIAGVWRRLVAGVTTILTLFFTALTLLLVIFNPEMDCGCFGEAIHLTHMQTFIKNLVLCALCAGAFLPVGDYGKNRPSKVAAFFIVAATVGLFTLLSLRSIPLMDFMEFAPGAILASDEGGEHPDSGISLGGENDTKQEYYVIYEKNGREGVFTLDNLPDSTWTFVRVEDIERSISDYEQSSPFLYISDEQGDYHNELLSDGKVMLLSIYDVPGFKHMGKAIQFLNDADAAGFTPVIVARESIPELGAYLSDYKKLLTLNRSNGGVTYLDDGEVICKWPVRRLPDAEELAKVASRNSMEQMVGRSSRRRIAFQGVILYSLAVLLIL